MDTLVLRNLRQVADALREAGVDDFVFVGGAAVGLLLTDPAAPEPRFTFDVDVVTKIHTRPEYYALERTLRRAGHAQVPEGPICRWTVDGVIVDVMPLDASILGFSNRWYPQLMEHAFAQQLPGGTEVLVASPPYLVASKLEAFANRGGRDARLSQDFEDVVILFDGRPELVREMAAAPADVRAWVADKLRTHLASSAVRESISGHLPPDAASQARAEEVLRRMRIVAEFST